MNLRTLSIRRWGAHSTGFGYRAPPYSIVMISSRGAAFSTAFTNTSIGFLLSFEMYRDTIDFAIRSMINIVVCSAGYAIISEGNKL